MQDRCAPAIRRWAAVLIATSAMVAFLGAARQGSPRRVATADQAAVKDSAAVAVLRFFSVWSDAWQLSESSRHRLMLVYPTDSTGDRVRRALAWCVWWWPTGVAYEYVNVLEAHTIRSELADRDVCPTWFLEKGKPPHDEANGIDASLTPLALQRVRVARRALIATLDSAVSQLPQDNWLVGQLVRFLIDQREPDSALHVASTCKSQQWWCAALRGYALAARGAYAAAGLAFDTTLTLMPDAVRCGWNDHAQLLESEGRDAYEKLACAQRDSVNERLWWLADPLYSVGGNERRVEQFVRHVTVALRAELMRDERFHWRAIQGGDALVKMVLRYGWPTYAYWSGPGTDIGRNLSQVDRRHTAALGMATTFEYDRDHVPLIPAWHAIQHPYDADGADWALTDPAGGDTVPSFDDWHRRRRPTDRLGNTRLENKRALLANRERVREWWDAVWWPREHAGTTHGLRQLDDGQVAVLRRDSSALLAIATSHGDTNTERYAGGLARAVLVASPFPGVVDTAAVRVVRASTAIVAYGAIASRPAIVGLEVAGDTRGASLRTRFGLTPPNPLLSMRPGEVAVSQPVITAVGANEVAARDDSALDGMLPSVMVSSQQKIGVYWESYGFAKTDTLDLAVWLERYSPQGLIRRLGAAFRLATNLNTPIAIQWQETPGSQHVNYIDGRVLVGRRSIVLDLAGLPKGEYWLDVAVARRGAEPTRSRRGIVVR